MPSAATLLVFSGAAPVLLLVPGPAVLYIVTRSANQGVRAGLVSVAGVHVGTFVHIAVAVAGLSAVIVASSSIYTTIKLAGAAYLVSLGVTALRGADRAADTTPVGPSRSARRIFLDGVILNVLNPKTAVFFMAFLPQFVDVDAGGAAPQIVMLGLVFVGLGLAAALARRPA